MKLVRKLSPLLLICLILALCPAALALAPTPVTGLALPWEALPAESSANEVGVTIQVPEVRPEDLTEEGVLAAMMAQQSAFPEGTPWTNDYYYDWNGGIYYRGYGCAGFAFLLSDAAFGSLPARQLSVDYDSLRVGDILRLYGDSHSVIILSVAADSLTVAEGNFDDCVHWGRVIPRSEAESGDYMLTRWPETDPNQGLPIDEEHFPDGAFRSYVAENLDPDGNGVLTDTERSQVLSIDCAGPWNDETQQYEGQIASLRGMEYFPLLSQLFCYGNQLTALDLQGNPQLYLLDCSFNRLTSLDLRPVPELLLLDCAANRLAALDLSPVPELIYLSCYENRLTALDPGALPALKSLDCSDNRLTRLNVKANSALEKLWCYNNQLLSLDLRFCPVLLEAARGEVWSFDDGLLYGAWQPYEDQPDVTDYRLAVGKNVKLILETPAELPIDEAHFPDPNFRAYVAEKLDPDRDEFLSDKELAAVTSISCGYKRIASLQGVEYFPQLQELYCNNNQLTALDLSGNPLMAKLYCYNNQLTSLDLSMCSNIYWLSCGSNQLTELKLQTPLALNQLYCAYNRLTTLDLRGCVNLTRLECNDNQLDSLGLEGCPQLIQLNCQNNALPALDLTGCSALTQLNCYGNQLRTMDLSGCSALTRVWCYGNQLESLDLRDQSKLNDLRCYDNRLSTLDLRACPSLASAAETGGRTVSSLGEGVLVYGGSGENSFLLAVDRAVALITVSPPSLCAQLISRSISTKGNLGFNFYVFLSEELLADQGAYATLTMPEGEITLLLKDQEVSTQKGKECRKLQASVSARQVNDPVTLRVFDGQGMPVQLSFEETDYTGTGYTMSTQDILDLYEQTYGGSENATAKKLTALIRALSDYCSCAQAQFRYNMENRAEVRADLSAVTLEELRPYAREVSQAEESSVRYETTSLSLRSETVIKHYFTLASGAIEDYRIEVAGAAEDKIRLSPAGTGTDRWCLEILSVEARNLANPFTVNIYEKDGTEPVLSISYSALSYAYRVLELGNQSESLENVAKSLYLYSVAASAYFG